MFGWLKRLFDNAAGKWPDYKIVHDQRLGYIACYLEYGGYWGLTEHGTEGVSIDSAMDPFYGNRVWCKTAEEAGRRVNLHATKGGRKTVWEA